MCKPNSDQSRCHHLPRVRDRWVPEQRGHFNPAGTGEVGVRRFLIELPTSTHERFVLRAQQKAASRMTWARPEVL
jgi:hypothetical protein